MSLAFSEPNPAGFPQAAAAAHTALREIPADLDRDRVVYRGRYFRLFRQCLDHQVMMRILAEKIRDNRFLRLIANMLKAGTWRTGNTMKR